MVLNDDCVGLQQQQPPAPPASVGGGSATLPAVAESCVTGLATNSFFLFPLCKKIIDLPGGQINDPISLPFLQRTPSTLSRTLEGLFELT